MKAYTDIEQSKKLAKILPVETSDMRYGYIEPYDFSDRMYDGGYDEVPYPKDFLKKNSEISDDVYESELPCWSLTALIDVLPQYIKLPQDTHDANNNPAYKGETYSFSIERHGLFGDKWFSRYNGKHKRQYANKHVRVYIDLFMSKDYDNPIDACYEMILKLYEQKIL